MQSANDEHGTKLFQAFQPGYGAGLRVLFNKLRSQTWRSTMLLVNMATKASFLI
jgi:hypothetical protein